MWWDRIVKVEYRVYKVRTRKVRSDVLRCKEEVSTAGPVKQASKQVIFLVTQVQMSDSFTADVDLWPVDCALGTDVSIDFFREV